MTEARSNLVSESGLVRLTLVFSPSLESHIVQILLAQEPPLPGFTVFSAEGHGAGFAHASIREQVRGRVARKVAMLVLPLARAEPLVAELCAALVNTTSTWWLEPVLQFGQSS